MLITDAAIAALGLTMGLVQAVVCILYAFTLDLSPALARQMPTLLVSTLIFTALGLLFLTGFLSLRRRWRGHVLLQALVILSLAPAGVILRQLLG